VLKVKIYKNVLETIGKTPLININKLTQNVNATVVAKLEARNPGGSVKDRYATA
jgi:cystathionine beta-synthase